MMVGDTSSEGSWREGSIVSGRGRRDVGRLGGMERIREFPRLSVGR